MPLYLYTFILLIVVFIGASVNRFVTLNHRRTQIIMSFVSGIMLGVAVFHLLPHALYASEGYVSIDFVVSWLMGGLLGMFLLQRVFHFHQHDFDEGYADEHGDSCEHNHTQDGHAQDSHLEHGHLKYNNQSLSGAKASWGVFLGLGLHSLIDGVALAASMQASFSASASSAQSGIALAGLGVFLAILLHKPLDAMTIKMFLGRAGVAPVKQWITLFLFALLCPAMAALILAGYSSLGGESVIYIIAALAFSAGIFLCIALSDLLPEIHFHSHDRLKMTTALLAGIAMALAIKNIESEHSHKLKLKPSHHSESHADH